MRSVKAGACRVTGRFGRRVSLVAMRVVIDGLPVRGDNSLSIVSEHLLSGWQALGLGDELHFVARSQPSISIPDGVHVHPVRFGRIPMLNRVYAQSVRLPRLCRQIRPDVMVAVIPSTAVMPLPCPRSVIAWDFRYRALPGQFRATKRWFRRISYSVGFHQADGVVCISGRTKADVRKYHRRTEGIPVEVAHLGADHVDAWPVDRTAEPYAIAFGHFANKNVDLVLAAWAALAGRGRGRAEAELALRLVGVGEHDRARVEATVAELGLQGTVTVDPWLDREAFEEVFASSSLVVFPSDYEGFGLPAVEAMRLGIPLVIAADPALLEVTGGHATVIEGEGPIALAEAVVGAGRTTPAAIAEAQRHAARFTWANFALGVRASLGEVVAAHARPGRRRLRPAGVPAAAGVVAAVLAIGGVAAASYDLASSHSNGPTLPAPAAVTTTTTSPGAGPPDPGARGTAGHGQNVVSRGVASQSAGRRAGSNAPAPGAGSAGSSTTSSAGGGAAAVSGTLPPVTMPTVPIASGVPTTVTTPSVTVPTVTVPPGLCSTSTTVVTSLSIPCGAPVDGP